MKTILSSAYLAPIEYYIRLLKSDEVIIEGNENYIKQSYRNRCHILSANGAMALSIPIEHGKKEKIQMKDIKIADQANWQHLHWNAIVSAYNSTPFFEYYKDDFEPFYRKKYTYLFDFNESLRELIFGLLDIDCKNIQYSSQYYECRNSEVDLRNTIHPKKKFPENITKYKPYYQVFSQKFGFVENLSIIDLLFNMGNESLVIISDNK